jgi:hypothetical protein
MHPSANIIAGRRCDTLRILVLLGAALISKPDLPFPGSYWVLPGKLLAGQYPGHLEPDRAAERMRALVGCGIRHVINLMEADEVDHIGRPFMPYLEEIRAAAAKQGGTVTWTRHPIRDMDIPDQAAMRAILDEIDKAVNAGVPVYIHCWGGKGRTGTVIGCYLVRHNIVPKEDLLKTIERLRAHIQPHSQSPETADQRAFVLSWQPGM